MKLYLLSESEARAMKQEERKLMAMTEIGMRPQSWWLRNYFGGIARTICTDGSLAYMSMKEKFLIRPGVTLRRGAIKKLRETDHGTFLLGKGMDGNPAEWIMAGRKSRLLLKGDMGRHDFSIAHDSPRTDKDPRSLVYEPRSLVYENSEICAFLADAEKGMFSEEEMGLLADAPEGLMELGNEMVRISTLRSYLMEIGVMGPKESPSDVLGMFTEAEIRMICSDISGRQIV